MSKRLKKYSDHNSTAVPIFHGSSCEIRPEDFDFSMAVPESDFEKAAYFGRNYEQAKKWANRNEKGVVNWYIFMLDDAFNDPDIQILVLKDEMVWLDTILKYIDGECDSQPDIIVGDTMDSRTGSIIDYYQRVARIKGVKMIDLDSETKNNIIEELKPNVYDQQIAFKTQKGLKHIKFIGSVEVTEMSDIKRTDPSEVAARISMIISEEENIPLNTALIRFMKSDTFLGLISDPDPSDREPREILEQYRSEAS